MILHGLRRWYDHRGQLRHGGQRVSRHYYDVFRLLESPTGKTAEADRQLAEDCARHARMFFNTPDFDLDDAAPGTFSLVPSAPMLDALERDYNAMAVMIMLVVHVFILQMTAPGPHMEPDIMSGSRSDAAGAGQAPAMRPDPHT